MSATAVSPLAPAVERAPRKPLLSLVPRARASRPRLAYAVVAVSGIAAITATQLLVSIAISQGAYELDALAATQSDLLRTAESVSEDLDRVSSPQFLAANAESLGMVPNANPVYLRLSDAAVLGAPGATALDVGDASLVPNKLIEGIPLATDVAPAGGSGASAPVAPAASGTPSVAPATPVQPEVALQGGLPTPSTH